MRQPARFSCRFRSRLRPQASRDQRLSPSCRFNHTPQPRPSSPRRQNAASASPAVALQLRKRRRLRRLDPDGFSDVGLASLLGGTDSIRVSIGAVKRLTKRRLFVPSMAELVQYMMKSSAACTYAQHGSTLLLCIPQTTVVVVQALSSNSKEQKHSHQVTMSYYCLHTFGCKESVC